MESVTRHETSSETGLPNPVANGFQCQGELTSA
jgi:hypothetical protein